MGKRYIPAGLVAAAMALAGGCNGADYSANNNGTAQQGHPISDRSRWSVSGDLADMDSAIDGSRGTAAVGRGVQSRASFTIDLGKVCLFNMVTIHHGPNEWGFCRRVALLTSLDGEKFQYRWAAPGTRRVTILCVMTPILARYVRLQAMAVGEQPWSIGEVYLH